MKLLQNRKYITPHVLAIFIILVLFYSYSTAAVNTYPTQGWQISTPEEQGMRSQVLAEMMEHIKKNSFNIDSILIIRNGYMVLDANFWPFSKGQKHIIHSCTKSIMSALIGIAIDKGYIQNVDQPITDFFPDKEFANMDDLKKSITLENLLMMASGLKCRDSYLYRWVGLIEMRNSTDWAQYVLDLPMAEPPGEKFEYCNGVSYLLSVIIQNTTKMKTLDFARKHLFELLGITEIGWATSPQGIDIGYGEMWLKPHDMAKIGWLYLNKGRLGNKQILPSSWVEVSTRGHIDATPFNNRYGYQWWVDSAGYYMAAGYKGQRIFVVPEKNLVAVFTGVLTGREGLTLKNLLDSYIIPAASSPNSLPSSTEEQARLDALVNSVVKAPWTGLTERLDQYIEASLGDAQILNPILSADVASSAIESKVFEGLIDRDEELRFRGRLATHWEIFEEAYFYVNEDASVPDVGRTDAEGVVRLLRKAINARKEKDDPLSRSLANIERIEVLPPRSSEYLKEDKNPEGKKVSLRIRIAAPARIRLVLKHVDQGLFRNLEELLGREYFSSFDGKRFIQVHPGSFSGKREVYAREFLPATEHNPVIVFHLRPNVRFHDGHLFDAEDVKFTYEAIMNPRNLSPRVADHEPVKAVEVIDPLTVRIVYKELYSPALSTWAMGILPAHLLNPQALRDEAERRGLDPNTFTLRQSEFNRHPIGCGPFKFETWKPERFIRLRRFADYWEGAPEFREYIFGIIPDRRTQAKEFYAGALDSYGAPPPHQAEALKKDKRFQSFSGLNLGYTYIGYNIRREPFKDRGVRRALGMAIDVDNIINKVIHKQGERTTGPFVKQTDHYNQAIVPLPYDPEGALRLLAEAGWKRGSEGWLEKKGRRFQLTLITNQGNAIRKAILSIAQNSWRTIGIDVRTEVLDWTALIRERINKLDFDALILGWSLEISPDLYQIWHSSQTGPNQLNFAGFRNEEADDLIIKIRQEYDHDKQVAYCHRLHEIIAREQPYTFLYVGMWTALLDKRIVIKDVDTNGTARYSRIKPTKTGSYTFYFNKWIKLPQLPESLRE